MPSNNTSEIVPAAAPGHVVEAQAETDDEVVELWLGRQRSARTRRGYEADVVQFRQAVAKPLRKVKLRDVQAWAEGLRERYASRTFARKLSAVRSLFTFAKRIGYLSLDVSAAVQAPVIVDVLAERIIAEDVVLRMLHTEENLRNQAILRVLYGAGLRREEAATLRWRQVLPDRDAGVINIHGKGQQARTVFLTPATWAVLQQLRVSDPDGAPPDGPVFRSRKGGGALDGSAIWRVVHAAALRIGAAEPISPHWLRHAHASHALARHAPLPIVQRTLGHKKLETTGRYLHARPDDSSARYLPV